MDFLNTDEKRNRRLVHLPMGRFGEAVEVAKGALFRKSSESGSRSHARPHAVLMMLVIVLQWRATTAAT